MLMLVLNSMYYFFGAFYTNGDLSAVDMVLIFFGYYAQDLLRVGTLRLYYILALVSAGIDTLVTIIICIYTYKNLGAASIWDIVITTILYTIETIAKIMSAYYGKKLYAHLIAVPGQSVENV